MVYYSKYHARSKVVDRAPYNMRKKLTCDIQKMFYKKEYKTGCFVRRFSATWPSTACKLLILRYGFDSRLEPIAFYTLGGCWLVKALAHFAISLNLLNAISVQYKLKISSDIITLNNTLLRNSDVGQHPTVKLTSSSIKKISFGAVDKIYWRSTMKWFDIKITV